MRIPLPQDLIHLLDFGAAHRFLRIGLAVLAVASLAFLYDGCAFRNLGTQEAMDCAQVARNLAEGKGFTTGFIRPLSIFLVKRHSQAGAAQPENGSDPARLQGPHPDLANAPVYPAVLAGLMKALPFHYDIPAGAFARYQPDLLITVFNQLLFLALVASVFFLARRLFDGTVAWLSAGLLLGGELYWRFTVSGLPTIMLLLIFTGLAGCLARLEEESRQPQPGLKRALLLAAAIGALLGLGGLTRYGFAWLVLPVVAFLAVFSVPRRRGPLIMTVLVVFAAVMAPWIARNLRVSGTPFGTAGYTILETYFDQRASGDLAHFSPQSRLLRSLAPDFSRIGLGPFWAKLMTNAREIVQTSLPRLGGTWVNAFFLVGLLVRFRNPSTQRMRHFVLLCLPVLGLVQALGRTQLSDASPEINSENYLVLLAPLVVVYGVGLFLLLLDQVKLPVLQLRYVLIGLFAGVACLPMGFVFLPPPTRPIVYPPYYPPHIRELSACMKENELMMSDIPWAVAWYGERRCIWLTLQAIPSANDPSSREDFLTINDFLRPVQALYLTSESMDRKFLSEWIQAGEQSWGNFIAQTILLKEIPTTFPLQKARSDYFPFEVFLTDRVRWQTR